MYATLDERWMRSKQGYTTSTLTEEQLRQVQAAVEETYALEEAFLQEIEALIDDEISENQIVTADITFLDWRNKAAVLTVWRRAAQGDCIEELRSLVDKDSEGNLRCRIIKQGEQGEL